MPYVNSKSNNAVSHRANDSAKPVTTERSAKAMVTQRVKLPLPVKIPKVQATVIPATKNN